MGQNPVRAGTAAGEGGRGAVLILDDEPDVLELLSLVLRRAGFAVTATADGREALRLLGAGRFDAALADLLMPGMGGRQFLAEVARLPAERRPNVLVVSALAREAVDRELAGVPRFGVVAKPFELAAIEAEVARAVAARRAAGP